MNLDFDIPVLLPLKRKVYTGKEKMTPIEMIQDNKVRLIYTTVSFKNKEDAELFKSILEAGGVTVKIKKGYFIMEDWQNRVIEEEKELKVKIDKLVVFFNTDTFKKLSKNEKILLDEQCKAMMAYSSCLRGRIILFKV